MVTNQRLRLGVDERRAQLLSLGKNIFGSHCFDGISTDEIASMAGVSKGLLYHYFPSKRSFYIATIQALAEELLAATEPSPLPDPTEGIQSAVRRFLLFVGENEAIYKTLIQGGIGSDPECQQILDQLRATIAARLLTISEAPPYPEQQLRLYGWIGMAEFVAIRWLEAKTITREEAEDTLITSACWAIFGDASIQSPT
jgi:AcrR family transcriptional regulator